MSKHLMPVRLAEIQFILAAALVAAALVFGAYAAVLLLVEAL